MVGPGVVDGVMDIGGGVCVARMRREFDKKGEAVSGARSVDEGAPRTRMRCGCEWGRVWWIAQGCEWSAKGSRGSRGRKTSDGGRGGIKEE